MKRGAEVAATSRGLDAVKQVIWARLSGSDRRLIRTSGSDNRISLHVLLLAVGSLLAEAILARTLQPADTETEAQEESHAQDSSANLEEAKSPGVTVLPEGQKRPLRDDAPLIDDDLTEALKSLRALVNRTLGEIGAQPLDDAKAPSPNFLSWKSDDWSALGAVAARSSTLRQRLQARWSRAISRVQSFGAMQTTMAALIGSTPTTTSA
ncbi:MAG: hypothetical protein EBS73_14370 [Betaproteobacteria bacterium]|nr:hypothetical protein [Betaproteobacteria bacterium]